MSVSKLKISILKESENFSLEEIHSYLKVLEFPTVNTYEDYGAFDYLSQSISAIEDEPMLTELLDSFKTLDNLLEGAKWRTNHYRLFLSHRSEYSSSVKNIKSKLLDYGIHSFVAHEDIEVSSQWRDSLADALKSSDALLAYITDDFHENSWCLQEVGYACVSNLSVVPVRLSDKDPTGFLSFYQAGSIRGKNDEETASYIASTLLKIDFEKYIDCILNCLGHEPNFAKTKFSLQLLSNDKVPLKKVYADRLEELYLSEEQVSGYYYAEKLMNKIRENYIK